LAIDGRGVHIPKLHKVSRTNSKRSGKESKGGDTSNRSRRMDFYLMFAWERSFDVERWMTEVVEMMHVFLGTGIFFEDHHSFFLGIFNLDFI
jgi:hypothetical protein